MSQSSFVQFQDVSAVFDEANNPVAVQFDGNVFSPEGAHLHKGDVQDFCEKMGIKSAIKKPRKREVDFLVAFRSKKAPSKKAPKKKAARASSPKKREEPKVVDKVFERLKERFTCEVLGRHNPIQILSMEDKHGRAAQAIHRGDGVFEAFRPREGGGNKTVARNRWAAKEFERLYKLEASIQEEMGSP